ncbi:hypothetical protein EN812_30695 [Mesorhizobium sp. M4B.F.Ca.ET.169.01.1.1]|uniref:hypothetical protein n=1 Tax=Mesorhizobium sp. M4B.F.Ca.ET.169.01.1.1 TaxID=2563949 RepID=UPI001093B16C|nr:hypothetical protein [Mesorhizobium sp. M4B.F.Ca.ET.169.01.1.1]TGT37169.1 hypothetical protein EN812_30695 [Mesorhizobium sp. M4B.F.Ca.ET.169.01.1.1]
MTAFIMVNAINNVQVVDGTPLSPGPANADDVEATRLKHRRIWVACRRCGRRMAPVAAAMQWRQW